MMCSLEKAELSLSLILTLVPVTSDLIQRHSANWAISHLNGWAQGIKADIKQDMGTQGPDQQESTEANVSLALRRMEVGRETGL
jgi:hypothetical protein